MEDCLQTDLQFRKVLVPVRIIYILAGLILAGMGAAEHSWYKILVSLSTILLIPGIWLARRMFRWKGGWQIECYVYLFSFLGWTLGGAGLVYDLVPHFDKLVHCLSGLFVSVLILALYRVLEGHRKDENRATPCLFVFFGSMAVAGMFELCEFALAPVMGRDLQHVLETGVTDTMMDILVCMIGTIVYILLMLRASKGKHDPLTDAAEAFGYQNRLKKGD